MSDVNTASNMVKLMTSDGKVLEVSLTVAKQSKVISRGIDLEDMCVENSKNFPVPNVTERVLKKVIEYCEKHIDAADESKTVTVTEEGSSTIQASRRISRLRFWDKQFFNEELEYADTDSGVIDSPSITNISPTNAEHDHASFDTEQSGLSKDGLSGVGYIWTSCETGNEEEWRYSLAPISEEKLNEFYAKMLDEDETSSDAEQTGITHSGELLLSTNFDDSDGEYKGDVAKFDKEVEETFERALGGVTEENVQLEINSLRLSFNVSHAECAGAVFQSVIKSALVASNSKSNLLKATIDAIEKSKRLLKYFITNVDEEKEVILKFEEMCMETAREFSPIFSSVLHQLYEKEVITENAILKWELEKAEADESDKVFVEPAESFLKWLKEAPEEDEEDE